MTHNLHAGVDGWGRATNARETVVAQAPDVVFVQELWRGEVDDDVAFLEHQLGLRGLYVPLARCVRVTGATKGRGWASPVGLVLGDKGLYYTERRPLSKRRARQLRDAPRQETGTWGIALLTTLSVISIDEIPLPQLRRDKVRRVLIVARLNDGDHDFYAVAVHGAHLSHGSLLQYRHVAKKVDALSAELPVVVGGDFNCWRPLLRVVLRSWRSLVRARTWPASRPHSQIDHLLARGPFEIERARTVRGTSDHLALVVDVRLVESDPARLGEKAQ